MKIALFRELRNVSVGANHDLAKEFPLRFYINHEWECCRIGVLHSGYLNDIFQIGEYVVSIGSDYLMGIWTEQGDLITSHQLTCPAWCGYSLNTTQFLLMTTAHCIQLWDAQAGILQESYSPEIKYPKRKYRSLWDYLVIKCMSPRQYELFNSGELEAQ